MKNKLRHKYVYFLRHKLCRNFVNSKGAVTAEAAVNSLSIATLLAACMSVLIIMHGQFSVYEAARTGSRMLARGESDQVVYERIQDIAPLSDVQVNYSTNSVTVWVTNEPIGVVSWLRTTVVAHSTSGLE
jgi:Flp pilus assembly protein TadG